MSNELQATKSASTLRKNATAYQKIVMPDGSVTGGRFDRSITSQVIFPDDMTGLSYLDIGTMEGFFPFEALRRGASRVVGLDMNANYVHNANVLAQKQGLPGEFHQLDIDFETPTGQFDYVSCLNVLHHLIDPLEVIQKLISVTKKRLILEVAGLGYHERKKLKIPWVAGKLIEKMPLIYVRKKALTGNRQKFFISAPAMKNYLLGHRFVFSDVEIIPSPFKGRYIAIGHRRNVRRLVIVAGPTAAGKSTLIDRMSKGQASDVAEHLNLSDPSTWSTQEVEDLSKSTVADYGDIVVPFDFLSRLKWNITDYRKLQLMDLIRCAEEVQVLTVGATPELLREQFESSKIQSYVKKHGKQPNKGPLVELRDSYRDPEAVRNFYQHWFDFVSTGGWKHSVIANQDQPALSDPMQWIQSVDWQG
ncbi:tRNA (mo5U34)-methyltransferase [Stieleria maiorica]|uniref:tRNA (Mo5U34)-methyltransferase n=1 Tax=Stieleria maiorica TaxID=2795974 RepID=A0A5B9MGM2_9BACT|nr:class I SAM-dependent methyltransferase [Stieleria maiorica]QEF99649.1 tRNA (mo5U34)-methyltransferase [Stieleria maiorica]